MPYFPPTVQNRMVMTFNRRKLTAGSWHRHARYLLLLGLTGCAGMPAQHIETATPAPVQQVILKSAPASSPSPTPSRTPISALECVQEETLAAATGVKAVVLNQDGSRVYSVNLEGMSVYEYARSARRLERKLVFVPHRGTGFNYRTKRRIRSFQEKPVEAYFTHQDRYLWISLHNAGGVVVWDLHGLDTAVDGRPFKDAFLYTLPPYVGSPNAANWHKQRVRLLWIKTGSTPKVITATPDDKYLFVSNWHSGTVSVIDVQSSEPKDWSVIKQLGHFPIPRGLAVTPDSGSLFISQMGSSYISKYGIPDWKEKQRISVGTNPRHVVVKDEVMYLSLNRSAQLKKYDLSENRMVAKAQTKPQPRTIALSYDAQLLFVTCYQGNALQVFRTSDLVCLGTWSSRSHPVAVAVFQDQDRYEAWVGNYSSGTLRIFTFSPSEPKPLTEGKQDNH